MNMDIIFPPWKSTPCMDGGFIVSRVEQRDFRERAILFSVI